MNYIVLDLEFNQDYSSLNSFPEKTFRCPFEIIQIGAIKIDSVYHTVATFNHLVKPTIYQQVNPLITDLTGITTKQLLSEELFPVVFNEFTKFIVERDSVFCTWGMSDMKELYRNIEYHELDKKLVPDLFINLQPYVSSYLNLSRSKLLKLQTAVETLGIDTPYKFHDAFYDAFYTAEIFKIINHSAIIPMRYHSNPTILRPRQQKKVIDTEQLIEQFEKMYARELTEEEQAMILLAYKMGKTQQFLK